MTRLTRLFPPRLALVPHRYAVAARATPARSRSKRSGVVTRRVLPPAVTVLTSALCLAAVAPLPAASAQSKDLSVSMTFYGQKSGGPFVEELSAFSVVFQNQRDPQSGLPTGTANGPASATMPVNNTSTTVLTTMLFQNENVKTVEVDFRPALATASSKPAESMVFINCNIRTWSLQDEEGTGASVQVSFTYQKVDITTSSGEAASG